MRDAEKLLEEAAKAGIAVHQDPLEPPGLKGMYLKWADQAVILHNAETEAELCCLLAEELGHHATAPRTRIHYQTIEGMQAEARARQWAHRRLLPPARIMEAVAAGMGERWEIAEYLEVTESFLQEALHDYICAGLLPNFQR